MKAHRVHLKYVLRHKWYVLIECWKVGLFWRGIKHDWSKFLPSEWFPYVRFFNGKIKDKLDTPIDFEIAWNRHQKRNDHHWQYWVRLGDDGTVLALQMPTKSAMEMVCDWKGAGKALGKPDTLAWYRANRKNMTLHSKTRFFVEQHLHFLPGLEDAVDIDGAWQQEVDKITS